MYKKKGGGIYPNYLNSMRMYYYTPTILTA